jgi:hypothetical protein
MSVVMPGAATPDFGPIAPSNIKRLVASWVAGRLLW